MRNSFNAVSKGIRFCADTIFQSSLTRKSAMLGALAILGTDIIIGYGFAPFFEDKTLRQISLGATILVLGGIIETTREYCNSDAHRRYGYEIAASMRALVLGATLAFFGNCIVSSVVQLQAPGKPLASHWTSKHFSPFAPK